MLEYTVTYGQIEYITQVEWSIFDSREIIRVYYYPGTWHLHMLCLTGQIEERLR